MFVILSTAYRTSVKITNVFGCPFLGAFLMGLSEKQKLWSTY